MVNELGFALIYNFRYGPNNPS